MKKLFLFIAVISLVGDSYTQDHHYIVSLLTQLKKPLPDSVKAGILDDISWEYFSSDKDSGLIYAEQLLSSSEKTNYKKGVGLARHGMGTFYLNAGKYPPAIDNLKKALEIRTVLHDKRGLISTTNNLGVAYEESGNFDEALKCFQNLVKLAGETGNKQKVADAYLGLADFYHIYTDRYNDATVYYQKALEEYNTTRDKNSIANLYYKIGFNYWSQGLYPDALKSELTALKLMEHLGDKAGTATVYEVIGQIYDSQHDYPDALRNLQKAVNICEEAGGKSINAVACYCWLGVTYFHQGRDSAALVNELKGLQLAQETKQMQWEGIAFIYLGHVYEAEKDYTKAVKGYLSAIDIYEIRRDKHGIVRAETGLGIAYEKMNRLQEALKAETKALTLAQELQANENIKEVYEELSVINARLNNFKEAYANEVLFKQYYDTIYNKENEKKLTGLQLTYEFNKQQDSIKTEQAKRDVFAKQQLQRQKAYTGAGIVCLILVVLLLFFVYRNYANQKQATSQITIAHQQSEKLLLNILPAEVAAELKAKGSADARLFEAVSVLFTDFKNFTTTSERLTPQELVSELHQCFKAFDEIIGRYKIEKIKTVGDAYLAASGLPVANPNHAADLVNAALEIRNFMLNRRKELGERTFEVRVGINSGKVVAGIVGVKKFAYDIWGDTVNTAARMEQNGQPGKVNISETTYELVKDKFTCEYRGEIEAKNKGMLKMYFVDKINT